MLPEADLPLRLIDDRAYLDYLGPQDEPWLRVLLAEMFRFEGRRRRELAERLAEPLPCDAPYFKRRAATRVLVRAWNRAAERTTAADRLRAELFAAAARDDRGAAAIVAEVAAGAGLTPAALMASLFSDLPAERAVRAPDPAPLPGEVALQTNLAMAQAVFARSASVELRLEGGVRPVVRLAKLRGLICHVSAADPERPVLEISGPFSLFRHTLIYGRALAELLPHLVWCARFQAHARALLRGRLVHVSLENGDPLFPARAPQPFDSRLEQRFARDIAKLAPDWDIVREPEPVPAGNTLVFPDFMLRHRLHPERRALVEIVGFWTPEYLTQKFAKLREARLTNLVLCIDADRACAADELPPELTIVRFKRRVDAAEVLRAVERLTGEALPRAA